MFFFFFSSRRRHTRYWRDWSSDVCSSDLAVRGDEVLQHGEAFAEVRGDRVLDDLAGRTRHEAAHAGELADLLLGPSGSGVRHDVDRVELLALLVRLLHLLEHRVRHLLGDVGPDGDDLVVALAVGDGAVDVLPLDVQRLLVRSRYHLLLARGDGQIVDADGDAGAGGVGEAQVLDDVEHVDGLLQAPAQVAVLDQVLQALLAQDAVDVGHALRKVVVEDDASHRRVDDQVLDVLDFGVDHVLVVVDGGEVDQLARVHEAHRGQRLHLTVLQGQDHVVHARERAPFALGALLLLGEVVAAEHDVLRGHRDGLAGGRGQDVVRGQHEHAGLDLRLRRERHVHGHLVPVEVGVEGRADEGVDLDGFALDQDGLEGLDAQAVQRGGAVQEHRVLADDVLQEVPDLRTLLLHHLLGRLDGGDQPLFLQLRVDEGLEQLQGHLLGQAALVELELGADHDDRAARVVHALAEQVLAEPALLALQGVGEGLQRTVVGPAQHAAAAAVVEERVHRFLEHALLVAHDDVGRAQLDELLQAVVAVDDAPVEVVQVGGREAAAVQRPQRTQLPPDHRDDVQDHPLRLVARLAERLHDLEALGVLDLLLDGSLRAHLVAQLDRVLVHVHAPQQLLDRLRAHGGAELGELLAELPVALVRHQLLALHLRAVAGVHHHVRLEVEDALQVAQGDVEQVPDAAGQPLEEPHVADRAGQLDVAHALAAPLGLGDLDSALVADHAPVLHALVLAAEALPVRDRPEDLRAEEAVPLRLEGAVVDRLRLGHLAVGPAADLLRAGQADLDQVEVDHHAALIHVGPHRQHQTHPVPFQEFATAYRREFLMDSASRNPDPCVCSLLIKAKPIRGSCRINASF